MFVNSLSLDVELIYGIEIVFDNVGQWLWV